MDILSVIWGLKTTSLFDFWSLEHLIAGMSLFGISHIISSKTLPKETPHEVRMQYGIILVLLFAYAWEAIEFYGEIGAWGAVAKYWFYGVEFWPNRVIVDPLLVVGGYYLAQRNNHLVIPARIFSIIWLFIHVFVFPHSMYLNEVFL